jgi:hypothetical protein
MSAALSPRLRALFIWRGLAMDRQCQWFGVVAQFQRRGRRRHEAAYETREVARRLRRFEHEPLAPARPGRRRQNRGRALQRAAGDDVELAGMVIVSFAVA